MTDSLHNKDISGMQIAGISGAEFETVGIADSLETETASLSLTTFNAATVERFSEILKAKRLDTLMEIRNTFDINPGADDETHLQCVETAAADPEMDAVVIGMDPCSPVVRSLEKSAREGFNLRSDESSASTLPAFVNKLTKPVIAVVEGGTMYDAFSEKLMEQGVCVFRATERAVKTLAKYSDARINADHIRSQS